MDIDRLLAATADMDPRHPRGPKAEARDRALLEAASGLPAFTTHDVSERTAHREWYGAASLLLRTLHAQGVLRIVSPEGKKPYVYAWVGGPVADLDVLRDQRDVDVFAYVAALEAEVDRLRQLVGEPPLTDAERAA